MPKVPTEDDKKVEFKINVDPSKMEHLDVVWNLALEC